MQDSQGAVQEADWQKYLREHDAVMYKSMQGTRTHEQHIVDETIARVRLELQSTEEVLSAVRELSDKLTLQNRKFKRALDLFLVGFAALNASINAYKDEIMKEENDNITGSEPTSGH